MNTIGVSWFALQWDPWWPALLHGVWHTLVIAACAGVLGTVLARVWAFVLYARIPWLSGGVSAILAVVRSLPEMLLLLSLGFWIGPWVRWDLWPVEWGSFDAWVSAIVGLGLLFSSYAAQLAMSALAQIPSGQSEAARLLGLPFSAIWSRILWPQASTWMRPGLANLWLILLKDTALVSLLGITDLMQVAKGAAASSGRPFYYLLLAAGCYWLITQIGETVLKRYGILPA